MIKSNLPVILLKGLVLLPNAEARVELNNDISKKIINISKLYHDNQVLVVTPMNNLESTPDTNDLPKIGVVSKITSKIDLPNGNIRIVIKGEKRVKVISYVNYSNENDVLESIITSIDTNDIDEIQETALLRKLINELDNYISINPYISNSILSQIKGITDLDKLTDLIANFLPLIFEKKLSLMLDMNKISRAKRLITEINVEIAVLELENKIELQLKNSIDSMQKEMLLKEKIKAIKEELGEKDIKTAFIEEVKTKLDNYPDNIKDRISLELNRYETTIDSSPEISVIRNYIETLLKLPNEMTSEVEDLQSIEDYLNTTHYGLEEAKNRIIEYIAIKSSSNKVNPPIICLIGPPGVGKTTLAKSIANSLNKKYEKISLGGINDPQDLIGHKKTYIGSSPGKIINALIHSESKNPLILLDEVDKLSKDYKGDPASTLLDLLDNTQNSSFVDNYIEEKVDLSNVTWILTANDISLIPYVLLDRLEVINLDSYLPHEKIQIAENYLIPTIKDTLLLNKLEFEENIIKIIINNYTKESGVRELDRLLNKLIRKVITKNKLLNIKSDSILITKSNVKEHLGNEIYVNKPLINNISGITLALAYTPLGGTSIEIEVTSYEGEARVLSSGSLGNVLKESIEVSISYIKSNLKDFNLKKEDLNKTIHINFREGATSKDGPSAGVAITSAILSHLLNKPISNKISMSGEITLLGDVLPVGGLREKSVAAINNNIDTIYLSKDNKNDVIKLDKVITKKITFIYVDNYTEIYKNLFINKK